MKRIIVVVLVVCIVFSLAALLTGCGKKGVCDGCGEHGNVRPITVQGETGYFCKDCYPIYKQMANMMD